MADTRPGRHRPLRILLVAAALAAGCGGSARPAGGPAAAPRSSPATTAVSARVGWPAPAGSPVRGSPGGPAQSGRSTPTGSPNPAPAVPAAAMRPATLPRGGRVLLPGWCVVAYYGAAGLPALGALGNGPPDAVWPRLAAAAASFGTPSRPALPAYELIAVIADADPGPEGLYRSSIGDAAIGSYLASARRHHALLILDIQPGRSDFLTESRRLERWLREPDVALAIDPEWRMHAGEVPGQLIGSVSAAEVNAVSAWLAALTVRYRLPQKLLLIHQFTPDMIRDKPALVSRPHLATVVNMDGFGGREAKLGRYQALAADPRFGLGLKLFYRQDVGIFAPREVLALRPTPSVIEYE